MTEKKKADATPPVVGGPADDTSVRAFSDKVKSLVTDAISGDYMGVLKELGSVASVVFDLLGMSNLFGSAGEEDEEAALVEVEGELQRCKAHFESPQVVGAAGDPDVKKNPAMVLAIIQLVTMFIEMIRNRRKPVVPPA